MVSPCGLDTGEALGVVTAENELLHHLGDALDAKTPIDDRVLGFVLIGKALKMLPEQKLEDVDPARLVHPLGDRSELKRYLISHIDIEQGNGCT